MKFGIDYFPDVQPDRVSGQQSFADVLDLAEEADRLGYDSVKIVEHYFTSYGGYSPDPGVFLAACSQRTRRLRMVTGAGRTGAAGHRWTADGRPAAPR
jgi:alkanesulfonate monooxygenase SsuD/methylene tetrahydromethanopterin reductase-like flavin-dependent oxidoreductase (luciferase family)